MANPHKGEVEFKANGKIYILHYSVDAICALEEATGKSLLELAEDMRDVSKLRLGTIRVIFHAGLRDHHPELTVEQAGELILSAGGAISVMGKFSEAMAASFPKQEASETPRPRKGRRVNGTGSRS